MAKEEKMEWIPVSERLPESYKYSSGKTWEREVLVTAEFTWNKGSYFITTVEANDIATINKRKYDSMHIIAWMPLPKVYEEPKKVPNTEPSVLPILLGVYV